jgi:hypothetical protein
VRYVHLHDGPKIVHHYDLHEVAGHGGEYRFRYSSSADESDDPMSDELISGDAEDDTG